jgi:hypothetical protein
LKYVTKFLVANANNSLATKQPINPVLGETHNSKVGECFVSLEQISHHPPVSAIFVEGPGFTSTGTFQIKPSLSIPHAYMYLYGE